MKNLITSAVLFFVTVSTLQAQKFKGLDKSPMDMIEYAPNKGEQPWARILYSRPQLKGRDIATLVPDGKLWRMGANEATEVTLYTSMKVGNTTLDAGTYTMYAIPAEGEITLIINKATHVWGSYSYSQDLDVARITAPLSEVDDSLEAFSMIFEKGSANGMDLHLGWGYNRATVSFSK